MARQWNWSYRLPGEDGKLGAVAVSHTTADNPLGIDPSDPFGQDDIIIYDPVLHLKVDQAVTFLLRSNDVLHNFHRAAVPRQDGLRSGASLLHLG